MKLFRRQLLFLALSLSVSCSRKADLKTSMSELERAFPSTAPAQTSPAAPSAPLPSEVSSYVGAALSAVKTRDFAAGIFALEQIQRKTGEGGMTANQLMRIEQAKQALISDLVNRADRGDSKAKAELEAIEKMHSQ